MTLGYAVAFLNGLVNCNHTLIQENPSTITYNTKMPFKFLHSYYIRSLNWLRFVYNMSWKVHTLQVIECQTIVFIIKVFKPLLYDNNLKLRVLLSWNLVTQICARASLEFFNLLWAFCVKLSHVNSTQTLPRLFC